MAKIVIKDGEISSSAPINFKVDGVSSSLTLSSSGLVLESGYLTLPELSEEPPTPPAGKIALYASFEDSKLYFKNDFGDVYSVVSGSASTNNIGGTDTQIQFNSGSTFSGSSNLIYNYNTNILSGVIAQFVNITGNLVGTASHSNTATNANTVTNGVYSNSNNILTGINTFNTNYITASITGSNAKFTTITGSTVTGSIARFGIVSSSVISASQYIGLPSFSSIPAGTTGQIQFNSNNSFAADSNFVWNNTNKRLGVGTSSPNTVAHFASSSISQVSLTIHNTDKTDYNISSISFVSNTSYYTSSKSVIVGSRFGDGGDRFGSSVAISKNASYIVVGAYSDESGSTSATGLAYIFVSGAGGWTEQRALSGSFATQTGDNFGNSVAINANGSRVIVGAFEDESGATTSTGVAYIFTSGNNGWIQEVALSGSLATNIGDQFGWCVAINDDGSRVVVGVKSDESGSTNSTGIVYIFVSGNNGWTEQAALSGSFATQANDGFGDSVAINADGSRVFIGASADEPAAISSVGLVYVFVSGTNGWIQQTVLSGSRATDSSDSFGFSVATNNSGSRIIVGAPYDESSVGSPQSGIAYIFHSGTNGWTEQSILSGTFAIDNSDQFGISVAMNSTGDRVVVGASGDELSDGPSSGLAYVYNSGASGWTQQYILSSSAVDRANGDRFGFSVSIADSINDRIVIGADGADKTFIYDNFQSQDGSKEFSSIRTQYTKHQHETYGSNLLFYVSDTGVPILVLTVTSGNLNINGTMRLGALVAGTNTGIGRASNGDITAVTSDSRLKNEVNTITSSLDIINNLRGVKFKWDNKNDPDFMIGDTEKDKYQIGLIAQEVETILPELVYLNGVKDYKSVRYPEMVAVLIEGIKELTSEINILKSEIQILKSGSI